MKKRIIAMVLCVLMVFSILPVAAFAEESKSNLPEAILNYVMPTIQENLSPKAEAIRFLATAPNMVVSADGKTLDITVNENFAGEINAYIYGEDADGEHVPVVVKQPEDPDNFQTVDSNCGTEMQIGLISFPEKIGWNKGMPYTFVYKASVAEEVEENVFKPTEKEGDEFDLTVRIWVECLHEEQELVTVQESELFNEGQAVIVCKQCGSVVGFKRLPSWIFGKISDIPVIGPALAEVEFQFAGTYLLVAIVNLVGMIFGNLLALANVE